MVLVVVRVTTLDHVVDQKWSIGVPRVSSYRYGCQQTSFFKKNTSVMMLVAVPVTTADHLQMASGAGDHSRPYGRPQVVSTLIQPNYGHIHTKKFQISWT